MMYLGYSIYHCEIFDHHIMRIQNSKYNKNEYYFEFEFYKPDLTSTLIRAMQIVEDLVEKRKA